MTVFVVLTIVACGALGFRWRSSRSTAVRHRRRLAAGLGFTIDLTAVVMGSGGTVHQAVSTIAERGPQAVRPAFQSVMRLSAAGELLADALVTVSSELGSSFQPLVGALVATERDGAPLSVLLQRLGDEAQQARRWQTEAMAKRLPVSLLVPLVSCLLPAVVIGAVVPLAVVAVRQLNF